MGWFQTPVRNNLDINTVNMMTTIRQHFLGELDVPESRPAKAARQALAGDVFMVTQQEALRAAQEATAAAEAELAASGLQQAEASGVAPAHGLQQAEASGVVPDDLDLITATPEELQQVLQEMHAEAQQQVTAVEHGDMTFTELLQDALQGFDIHNDVFDPQHVPQAPAQQPVGQLGADTDTAFDEDALVASILGE